jgi:sugar phosphate isomerase/epimerase
MKISYVCPHWGQESLSAAAFIAKAVAHQFDGIEINLPENNFIEPFMLALDGLRHERPDFVFIPQHILSPQNESLDAYKARVKHKLAELAGYQPSFINSHTGKDHFSFDDNCRIIEVYANFSAKTGIKVYHETHRGRFSFHASTLLAYLEKFPELELVGDFSHFCVVSESLLNDQQHILAQIIPRVAHIHARVGFEQGPQASEPFAPEWEIHLHTFVHWWKQMIDHQKHRGAAGITITPECGPAPYMPLLPFTQQPIASQWHINYAMKRYLQQQLLS